jgi:Uma2 family endonuclease
MTLIQAKRFTLEEYHRLGEIGFFHEDDRIELIRGEIVKMSAKGTLHSVCTTLLNRELSKLIGERATLRIQDPIILPSTSEPEPDVTIVQNRSDEYVSAHPIPADILLLIEIADSSLDYDKNVKTSLYAEAGIPDYWIFNLIDNWLEVCSEPFELRRGKFDYLNKRLVLPNQSIALPCFPDLSLDLTKVFPRKLNS